MFDKFFDVLNVSNFSNWARRHKPFQQPYYHSQDEQLNVNNNTITQLPLFKIFYSVWKKTLFHTLTPGKQVSIQEPIVMSHRKKGCF